jgi:hypothetical protein
MQGDFSRTTFDPRKHYSAVLTQQGRVQLDADANEQAAILLGQLRTTIADVIGPAAAPANGGGFVIGTVAGKTTQEDVSISAGRMYVGGIPVANDDATATYMTQPDLHLEADDTDDQLPQKPPFLVYLRVWERLITALQDPTIREVALGDPGPDTAARAKTIWQVAAFAAQRAEEFPNIVQSFQPTGQMMARAKQPPSASEDPCHLPPDSKFRGMENQLYRIEVHTGGPAWTARAAKAPGGATGNTLDGATFKWSRENASVVFPIVSIDGAEVKVTMLGRDGKLDLEVGDRVEIMDDTIAGRVADDVVLDANPQPAAPRLRQVVAIDTVDLLVTLDQQDGDQECGMGSHPFLRRWDHLPTVSASKAPAAPEVGSRGQATVPTLADDGALPLVEGTWLDIEDGVQVWFQPGPPAKLGTYRRGDYWLVPARTATGDILRPKAAVDPDGVTYHYALLATVSDQGVDTSPRKTFNWLSG